MEAKNQIKVSDLPLDLCGDVQRGFLRFLKERGVYAQYIYNFYNYCKYMVFDDKGILATSSLNVLKKRLNDKDVRYYISTFLWKQTKEGDAFWKALHDEWGNTYINIQKS